MADDSQHPSILDKVSAKTRGFLVQAQKARESKEQEQQAENMSSEQTWVLSIEC